jgi:hypothetical protein
LGACTGAPGPAGGRERAGCTGAPAGGGRETTGRPNWDARAGRANVRGARLRQPVWAAGPPTSASVPRGSWASWTAPPLSSGRWSLHHVLEATRAQLHAPGRYRPTRTLQRVVLRALGSQAGAHRPRYAVARAITVPVRVRAGIRVTMMCGGRQATKVRHRRTGPRVDADAGPSIDADTVPLPGANTGTSGRQHLRV